MILSPCNFVTLSKTQTSLPQDLVTFDFKGEKKRAPRADQTAAAQPLCEHDLVQS